MPVSQDQLRSGGAIEIIEAPTAGAGVVLELTKALEQKIERFMVGQLMSGGMDHDSGLGGTGRADFARETKHAICANDAEELAETLTGGPREPGLISTMFRWTLPQFYGRFPMRWVYDITVPDPKERLAAVLDAAAGGVEFDEDEVRNLTGLSKPAEGARTIGGKQALPGPGGLPGQPPGGGPGGKPGGGEDPDDDLDLEAVA
jgi:hypothetical protein